MLNSINRYFFVSMQGSLRCLSKNGLSKAASQYTFAPPTLSSEVSSAGFKRQYSQGSTEQNFSVMSTFVGALALGVTLKDLDTTYCENTDDLKKNLKHLINEKKFDAAELLIQKLPMGPEKDAMIDFLFTQYESEAKSYWFAFAHVDLMARLLPFLPQITSESKKSDLSKSLALTFQEFREIAYCFKAVSQMAQGKDEALEQIILKEYAWNGRSNGRKNIGMFFKEIDDTNKKMSIVKMFMNRHQLRDQSKYAHTFLVELVDSLPPKEADEVIPQIVASFLEEGNTPCAVKVLLKMNDFEKKVNALFEFVNSSFSKEKIGCLLKELENSPPSKLKDKYLWLIAHKLVEVAEEENSEFGIEEESFFINICAQLSLEESPEKEEILESLFNQWSLMEKHDLSRNFSLLVVLSKIRDCPKKNQLVEEILNDIKATFIEVVLDKDHVVKIKELIDNVSNYLAVMTQGNRKALLEVTIKEFGVLPGIVSPSNIVQIILGVASDPVLKRHYLLQEVAGLLPGEKKDKILEKMIAEYFKGDERNILKMTAMMNEPAKKDFVYQTLAEEHFQKEDLESALDRAKMMRKGVQRDVVLQKIIHHAESNGNIYIVNEAADELFSVFVKQETLNRINLDL